MKTIINYITDKSGALLKESQKFLVKGHTKKQYTNVFISKLKLTEEQKKTIETLPEVFFNDNANNTFNDPNEGQYSLELFKTDIVCMFLVVAACVVLDSSIDHLIELGLKSYRQYGSHNPYDTGLETFEFEDAKGTTTLDYIIRWCKKSNKNFDIFKEFCDIYKTNKTVLKEPDDIIHLYFNEE